MSKLGDDIRRISRYEYLLKLINQIKGSADQGGKDPLEGDRATTYLVTDGKNNNTFTTNGSPGETQPNDSSIPSINPAFNQAYQEGYNSGSHNTDAANKLGNEDNLTTGDNTNKDGWFDTNSVLNRISDLFGKVPPAAGNLINTLSGLTTADGTRPMAVHLNDAAFSWVPPNTAIGAFDPGPDPAWTLGTYWSCTSPAVAYGSTPSICADSAIATVQTTFPTPYPAGYADAYWDPGTLTLAGVGDYTFVWYQGPGAPPNTSHILQNSCTGAPGGAADSCAVVAAPKRTWIDMGLTQLAWVTPISPAFSPFSYSVVSQFMPNPYDVNVPMEYRNGSSILDLKTTGGDEVRIGPLRDGGWYLYFRDSGNFNLPSGPSTDNSVYVIGADRMPSGFITPNELLTRLPI